MIEFINKWTFQKTKAQQQKVKSRPHRFFSTVKQKAKCPHKSSNPPETHAQSSHFTCLNRWFVANGARSSGCKSWSHLMEHIPGAAFAKWFKVWRMWPKVQFWANLVEYIPPSGSFYYVFIRIIMILKSQNRERSASFEMEIIINGDFLGWWKRGAVNAPPGFQSPWWHDTPRKLFVLVLQLEQGRSSGKLQLNRYLHLPGLMER